MEQDVNVVSVLEKDENFLRYNYFRNNNLIFIISILIYLFLVIVPVSFFTIPIFVIGNIGLLTVIIKLMLDQKKKRIQEKRNPKFGDITSVQLIIVILDLILVILFLFAYLPIIGPVIIGYRKAVTIIFQIVYFVKYIYVMYATYYLYRTNWELSKNVSIKDSRLYTGFFSYPIIILKFVFYKSDILLLLNYGFKGSVVSNILLANLPVYHLLEIPLLIIHVILIVFVIGYTIESSIRSYNVVRKITSKTIQ